MRLLNLTVNDLGLFRGRHDFDLTPERGQDGARHNLIAIKGSNGVGKSTLFRAMSLALHGSLSLDDRVSKQAYNDFLLKLIHRINQGSTLLVGDEASVALSFQYVQSGKPLRVQVERHFKRNGQIVNETLEVLCDGKPLDVDEVDYQSWLNDLMPPGLAALCFFDAEHLDALSDTEQVDTALGDVMRRLLGLDLVERLQADLENYTLSKGGGRKALDRHRAEVIKHQTVVDMLNAQITQLQTAADALTEKHSELESKLAEQERRLAAEGGAYASRRPLLQERLVSVTREIEALEEQLRDMSAELLPFALAPELCQSLSRRLKQESKARSQQAAESVWQERVVQIEENLQSDKLWQGLRVTNKDRKTLTARLNRALKKAGSPNSNTGQPLIHNLSEPESEKLQGWLTQATEVIPQKVKSLGERLRALQNERSKIESDLKRAPEDDILAPIHAEITKLQSAIEDARHRQSGLKGEMGALQFQRDDAERQLQRAVDELRKAQMSEKQLELAERSRSSLRAYKDALVRQRLAALEEALAASFNTICRKEHLLESARIDPDDFSIRLTGENGHALSLSEFSAGERQLYALALLWALRQVSGRQLPLVIDTPLARLDEVHRLRIIRDYIPAVSDQVLLFATDVELDEALMAEAEPQLARVYRLDYFEWSEYTQVRCDSQAPQGIVLYRGETPGAIGLDIHGGNGQTWTTDFEHATSYGEVERAVLPPDAKRLVLVNPDAGDYNWEHIAELERITKNRSISGKLRKGKQIYDIWRGEWTSLLHKAGYASIATVGIEGPEEYVLDNSKLIRLNGKLAELEEPVFDA